MTLDDTDRQPSALLRRGARLPLATLADKPRVPRGTVSNRLRKLDDAPVIVGHTVHLKPETSILLPSHR